jgi:16S rRNA (guanine527-N7)-methyltransferase
VKHEGERLPTTSPRSVSDRLRRYEELLQKYAVPRGLLSATDSNRLWERHILDSLRAVRCLLAEDTSLADAGSGAGLPGIPVAIAEPGRQVALIESQAKRAAFLDFAASELGLDNVAVVKGRTEEASVVVDACLARALAPAGRAWELTGRLLRPGGRLVYFAGRSWSPTVVGDLEAQGIHAIVCAEPEFAWQGPMVIMTTSSQRPGASDGPRRPPSNRRPPRAADHGVRAPSRAQAPRRDDGSVGRGS